MISHDMLHKIGPASLRFLPDSFTFTLVFVGRDILQSKEIDTHLFCRRFEIRHNVWYRLIVLKN